MIEQPARENLLAVAGAYAASTGLALATVSRQFHGNQAFLDDFKRGERSITLSKLDDMLEMFREHWPKGAKWPETKPIKMGRSGKRIAVDRTHPG